jgi:hypothetical protein
VGGEGVSCKKGTSRLLDEKKREKKKSIKRERRRREREGSAGGVLKSLSFSLYRTCSVVLIEIDDAIRL